MMTAERQIEDIDREIAAAARPKVVSLHPSAIDDVVAEWVRMLNSLKAGEQPDIPSEIRGLIVEVKVTPLSAKRGGEMRVDLTGRLDDLLEVVLAEPIILGTVRKRAVGATMTMTKSPPRNHFPLNAIQPGAPKPKRTKAALCSPLAAPRAFACVGILT
jgi:hypothetical protein